MKKFTSKKLIKMIKENTKESRKKRFLHIFRQAGKNNSNNQNYQLWQQHNHPIGLLTNEMTVQRLNYLHMNPVKAGFVNKPEDWSYSSAKQYEGQYGTLNLEIIRGL